MITPYVNHKYDAINSTITYFGIIRQPLYWKKSSYSEECDILCPMTYTYRAGRVYILREIGVDRGFYRGYIV